MKSLIIVLAALLAACTGGRQATVTVENDLAVSRENETVELSWKTLNTKIAELTAENVIVTNAKGEQIPSQVIYAGEAAPQALIFQASVDAEGSSVYTVTKGVRGEFKSPCLRPFRTRAHGRLRMGEQPRGVPALRSRAGEDHGQQRYRLLGQIGLRTW